MSEETGSGPWTLKRRSDIRTITVSVRDGVAPEVKGPRRRKSFHPSWLVFTYRDGKPIEVQAHADSADGYGKATWTDDEFTLAPSWLLEAALEELNK